MMTAAGRLVVALPLDPDAEEARQKLLDELGKAPYQAARPTWFDLLSQAIGDWIASLRVPDGSGFSALIPLVVVTVVVALIVVAFLVFGRPRVNRRSAVATGALFGDDDARSAVELRASAERAAAAGDFDTAIQEAFRGLARGLAERTIVQAPPGSTAQDFAARAGRSFPSAAAELTGCAGLFDGVRYLDAHGGRDEYERVRRLDRALQTERPAALEPVGAAGQAVTR